MPDTTKEKARRRQRKVESYAEWMMKVDMEVTALVRHVEREPPRFHLLHPAQQKIVRLLIEYMTNLPMVQADESEVTKPQYLPIKKFLTYLYERKYPDSWLERKEDGLRYIDDLPNGEAKEYYWMLRNCAGQAPERVRGDEDDE